MGLVGKKIDFKSWSAVPGLSANISADSTFLASGFLSFLVPATILRVRGAVQAGFRTSGLTIADEASIVFGLGIFSTDAVVAGAGSLPDPSQEPDYPWMWYGEIILMAPVADFTPPLTVQRLEVDTKAMRKVKPGESLVVVVQTQGAVAVDVSFGDIRVLVGT